MDEKVIALNYETSLKRALFNLTSSKYKAVFVYRESCLSTNELVQQEALKPHPPKAIIAVTNAQTRGRGRLGRSWISIPGKDITFSLGIRVVEFGVSITARYPIVCASIIARAIQKACGIAVETKWPNDLYVGNRKLCGILILNLRQCLITGIGINANSTSFEYPKELSAKVVSLRELLRHEIDRASIIYQISKDLLNYFYSGGEDEPALLQEWINRCCQLGKRQKVLVNNKAIEVIVQYLDQLTGKLICVDDSGKTIRINIADQVL